MLCATHLLHAIDYKHVGLLRIWPILVGDEIKDYSLTGGIWSQGCDLGIVSW